MILSKLLSIDEVNGLISEHFIKIFGNVVQNSTATAIGILKYRPFGNVKDLQNAIEVYLDSLKTVGECKKIDTKTQTTLLFQKYMTIKKFIYSSTTLVISYSCFWIVLMIILQFNSQIKLMICFQDCILSQKNYLNNLNSLLIVIFPQTIIDIYLGQCFLNSTRSQH